MYQMQYKEQKITKEKEELGTREAHRVNLRKKIEKEKLRQKEEEELRQKKEQEEKMEAIEAELRGISRQKKVKEEAERAKLKAEAESKQSLDTKPPITAPKPNVHHLVWNTAKETTDKKSEVTTGMKTTPPLAPLRKRVTVFGESFTREERPSTSRKVFDAQTEKAKDERNSSVITHTIKHEFKGGEREKDPHLKVREKFNLFKDSLLDSSPDGSKYSLDNKPIPTTSKAFEKQTEEKNNGKNSNVITHTIKKDFEEVEKEKDPHVKVRERFNLFRDSIKDFSWNSTNDSKKSKEIKTPLSAKQENTTEGQKSATEEIPTRKENLETLGTSKSTRFSKIFKNSGPKQENHSTSNKEVKKRVEKNSDGMVTHTTVNKFYYTNQNTTIMQCENKPEKVELTFRTYKDFKNNAAQNTITSSSSTPRKYIVATNQFDLELQGEKCKELDAQFKDDEARRGKPKEKKGRLQRAWSCCSGCCLQSFECL